MSEQFSRTELLYGKKAMEKLKNARVAVFGLGGVGGYVAEALARSGVGTFELIDNDRICESNLNRQIIALQTTIGQYKTEAVKERILAINPQAKVSLHTCFYLPQKREEFDFAQYSYVVDAVDTVTAKIDIIMAAKEKGIPVISAMGAGNKINPAAFEVADIYETSVCPLAKVMRRELRKRGVDSLKVVYSREEPLAYAEDADTEIVERENMKSESKRRSTPGSTAFCPSVAGLIMAGEIVNDMTQRDKIRKKR